MTFENDRFENILLSVIGMIKVDIERFRGVWYEDGQIFVCTRSGGDNAEYCPNKELENNPNLVDVRSDEDDNTYLYYIFSVPKQYWDDMELLASMSRQFISFIENEFKEIV